MPNQSSQQRLCRVCVCENRDASNTPGHLVTDAKVSPQVAAHVAWVYSDMARVVERVLHKLCGRQFDPMANDCQQIDK